MNWIIGTGSGAKIGPLGLVLALAGFCLPACYRGLPKKAILPDQLREVSGVYCAGPDSLWWHNDSGNTPVLYLTDRYGHFLDSVWIEGAEATDWEDLTGDAAGNLYLGDFGNNRNERRDLHILRYHPETGALARIDFTWPDQRAWPPPAEEAHFDCEAFFWYRDSLHLFSKARLGTGVYQTRHYTLPDRPGRYVATLRDSLDLPRRVVTAAAVDPVKGEIALLSYYFKVLWGFIPITRTSIFLFDGYPDEPFLQGPYRKSRVPKFLAPTQYEALDFYNPRYLLLASERTILFRQKLRYRKRKRQEKASRP